MRCQMTYNIAYEEVCEVLSAARRSMRCADLSKQLERLGFQVRDGKRGGHKLYFHDGLPSFRSSSFNCGHGKNPEIKPAYIRKVLKVLDQHKQELIKFLEGNQ